MIDPIFARLLTTVLPHVVNSVATCGVTCAIVLWSMRGFYLTMAKAFAAETTRAIIDKLVEDKTRLQAENRKLRAYVRRLERGMKVIKAGIEEARE